LSAKSDFLIAHKAPNLLKKQLYRSLPGNDAKNLIESKCSEN